MEVTKSSFTTENKEKSVSIRIWTRLTDSILRADNQYTLRTFGKES